MDGSTGRIWTEKVPTVGGSANGLVQDFNALVYETLGVVPVIFDTPKKPLNEALLYLGDQVLNVPASAVKIVETLKVVNRLYLDLVPSAEEERYLSILSAHNHAQRLLDWLASALPENLAKRLVLIAKADHTSSFTRVAAGSDLRSIVMSDHEIVMEGLDVNDPAIKKVLAWKQAEGAIKVVSIGKYLAGSKSIISVSQALQLIGNGEVQ
jgi:hypothetical protein